MFSLAKYTAVFGIPWHVNGKAVGELLTYTTYPGVPTGNLDPSHIGQECLDTVNDDFYKAVGTTDADWKQITA